MKLAAVVITYNPDESVVKNIFSYSHTVKKLFILDNSEKINEKITALLIKIPDSEYVQYLNNQGIALRLNQAAEMAVELGYTHLLTMDQDSSFDEGVIYSYINKADAFLKKHNNIGLFAANFQPENIPPVDVPKEVLSNITSGSIIDLEVYKKVGGYNNDLFLDFVDAEYCYKVFNAGYKTILFPDIILNHNLGYHISGRSLKNFKVTPRRIHSPIRMYYIVRNALYMFKLPYLNDEAKKEIKMTLSLLKNNILYNKRGKVISYIIKGYIDYKRGRMGKYKY